MKNPFSSSKLISNFTKTPTINKSGIIILIVSFFQQIGNYILIPFMTKNLGFIGYGQMALFSSYVVILSTILGLKTSQSALYVIKDYVDNKERLSKYINMIIPSIAMHGLAMIIIAIFRNNISIILNMSYIELIILVITSLVSYALSYITNIFTLEKKVFMFGMVVIFTTFVSVLLSIYFIKFMDFENTKYLGRFLAIIIADSLLILIVLFVIFSKNSFKTISKLDFSIMKTYIPLCIPIMIHSLSAVVFSQADRIMLRYMVSIIESGSYSFSYSVVNIINIGWGVLNLIFLPYYFGLLKENNAEEIKLKIRRFVYLFSIGFMSFLLILPEFFRLMSNETYVINTAILSTLALGMYINYLYTFDSNFESFYKKTKFIAIGTLLTVIINILLNIIFLPKFGSQGAAFTTLISYIALYLFHSLISKKVAKEEKVEQPFNIVNFAKWISIAVLMLVLFNLLVKYVIARYLLLFIIVFVNAFNMIKSKRIF